jgi:hypothetical protein
LGTSDDIKVVNFEAGIKSIWSEDKAVSQYSNEGNESDIPTNSEPLEQG